MAEVFDVRQWEAKPWFSTGGTRAKKYLQRPDGKYFYFKRSHFKAPIDKKSGKDYKYEFWSEIIAYEVGRHLGFEVLRYDIAIDKDVVGCISEDMILSDKEELMEGIKYLQGYDNSFNPEDRSQRKRYSFQLIEAALEKYEFGDFIGEIIKMLVFDAIIGNGDRHQENWAIIHRFPVALRTLGRIERWMKYLEKAGISIPALLAKPVERVYDLREKKLRPEFADAKLAHKDRIRFAPLYDNGSSLGRELTQEKVFDYLNNPQALDDYAIRGKSEIHWEGQKFSHYELLEKLLSTRYRAQVLEVIESVRSAYDKALLADTIIGIDKKLAQDYDDWKLPAEQKTFIARLIILRCQKLFALLP